MTIAAPSPILGYGPARSISLGTATNGIGTSDVRG